MVSRMVYSVVFGRAIKGVNFVNLRDAGDPVEAAAQAL
jgi:imidazole glycerol phosphate synthase subunit HisF